MCTPMLAFLVVLSTISICVFSQNITTEPSPGLISRQCNYAFVPTSIGTGIVPIGECVAPILEFQTKAAEGKQGARVWCDGNQPTVTICNSTSDIYAPGQTCPCGSYESADKTFCTAPVGGRDIATDCRNTTAPEYTSGIVCAHNKTCPQYTKVNVCHAGSYDVTLYGITNVCNQLGYLEAPVLDPGGYRTTTGSFIPTCGVEWMNIKFFRTSRNCSGPYEVMNLTTSDGIAGCPGSGSSRKSFQVFDWTGDPQYAVNLTFYWGTATTCFGGTFPPTRTPSANPATSSPVVKPTTKGPTRTPVTSAPGTSSPTTPSPTMSPTLPPTTASPANWIQPSFAILIFFVYISCFGVVIL